MLAALFGFFFFQAEDGIRDRNVTGVQTCALPILAAAVEGTGTWLELLDTRPLRDLAATGAARRSVRLGCHAAVEARSEQRIASGHLLDVSIGGARLSGIEGFAAGDQVELRLLSPDRLTFHDLSYAQVMWNADGHMGV